MPPAYFLTLVAHLEFDSPYFNKKSFLAFSVKTFLVEMRRTTHIAKAICLAHRPKSRAFQYPISHQLR